MMALVSHYFYALLRLHIITARPCQNITVVKLMMSLYDWFGTIAEKLGAQSMALPWAIVGYIISDTRSTAMRTEKTIKKGE
jgi:hypothetical protein